MRPASEGRRVRPGPGAVRTGRRRVTRGDRPIVANFETQVRISQSFVGLITMSVFPEHNER